MASKAWAIAATDACAACAAMAPAGQSRSRRNTMYWTMGCDFFAAGANWSEDADIGRVSVLLLRNTAVVGTGGWLTKAEEVCKIALAVEISGT